MGIEELLSEVRRELERLTPQEAYRAVADGALLIDIRSETQRAKDGMVPQARFVPAQCSRMAAGPELSGARSSARTA
jgi:hypothetical protein